MLPMLTWVIKGEGTVKTHPVRRSPLVACSISKRHHAHMLTAVSHTGVSRLRRVRTSQGVLRDHVVPRYNHHDTVYIKKSPVYYKPAMTVYTNGTC